MTRGKDDVDESRSPRRADAQRNAAALLDAARTVFAREGVDAHIKVIARQAGVGVATLYRHFPRRADLILAVLQREVDECVETARELSAAHAPMDALTRWLERYCAFVLTKRGLAAALHSGDPAFDGLGTQLLQQLEPALEELMQAARAAGDIGDGASAMDLLRAVAHLCTPGASHIDYTRRMITLLITGLRHVR